MSLIYTFRDNSIVLSRHGTGASLPRATADEVGPALQLSHLSQALMGGGRISLPCPYCLRQMSDRDSSTRFKPSGLTHLYLCQLNWLYWATQVKCRACSPQCCIWGWAGDLTLGPSLLSASGIDGLEMGKVFFLAYATTWQKSNGWVNSFFS